MRDQVCIILNEREPAKRAAAASLSNLLSKSSITASRFDVSEKIIDCAVERCPEILVLDYLLGDFATGLDIVYAINNLPETKRPTIFFLTDEPSVRVAVEAMHLGVRNYYQLDRKDSIPEHSEEIIQLLSAKKDLKKLPLKYKNKLENFIAQSRASYSVVKQTESIIKKNSKFIFIIGPQGSGRSLLAECIQNEAQNESYFENIDLKYFARGIDTLSQIKEGVGIVLENAEEDSGEAQAYLSKILKGAVQPQQGMLIVTSCEKETVKSWNKLLPFDVIELPSLEQRKEDIIPLAQSFAHLIESNLSIKAKKLSPEILSNISSMEWKGNVTQLKAAIIDSIVQASLGKEDLLPLIEEKKEKWLEYNYLNSRLPIDSLVAAVTVETLNHNYRLAAVKLGCSVRELYEVLNGARDEH